MPFEGSRCKTNIPSIFLCSEIHIPARWMKVDLERLMITVIT